MAYSPKTTRTRNSMSHTHSSQRRVDAHSRNSYTIKYDPAFANVGP